MSVRRTQLTVQAGSVTATVIKAGLGEPLVYLHGAFGYKDWPSFLDLLSQYFTVYAPIHPGFLDEDSIQSIDDVLDLTLYHYDLLDALGLRATHLAGHFFGAMIAAEMAALCPHRVNKLVLASPTGLWLEEDPGVDYFATPPDELRDLLFVDGDSEIARRVMPEPANDEERGSQAIDRAMSLSTVGKFLWPIPDKGLKKRIHRIRASTLVVVAGNDQIVPSAYGAEFADRITDSELQTIHAGGHLFILEQSDTFARLLSKFLI